MNFAVLTLTVEQIKPVDDRIKAKVTAYDGKGGPIPLIAYAYGRQGDRLAATPIGSSIVARCELKPGDKFSLMVVDIRAILGDAVPGAAAPIASPPPAPPAPLPPPPPPAPFRPSASLTAADLEGIPF